MKWPTFVTATVLTFGLTGCGYFGGDEEEAPPPTETAATAYTGMAEADLQEAQGAARRFRRHHHQRLL